MLALSDADEPQPSRKAGRPQRGMAASGDAHWQPPPADPADDRARHLTLSMTLRASEDADQVGATGGAQLVLQAFDRDGHVSVVWHGQPPAIK